MAHDSARFATDADVTLWYSWIEIRPHPYGIPSLATREKIIDWAECEFNEAVWGCDLLQGHLHYSAFLMELMIEQQIRETSDAKSVEPQKVGALASVSEGPQSVSFQSVGVTTNPSDALLMTKRSGQLYLHLRDNLGPVPVIAEQGGCDFLGDGCC